MSAKSPSNSKLPFYVFGRGLLGVHPTRVHLCNHYRPAEAKNEKYVGTVSMYSNAELCVRMLCSYGLNLLICVGR